MNNVQCVCVCVFVCMCVCVVCFPRSNSWSIFQFGVCDGFRELT